MIDRATLEVEAAIVNYLRQQGARMVEDGDEALLLVWRDPPNKIALPLKWVSVGELAGTIANRLAEVHEANKPI
jgi:hypothetical protein